VKTKTAKNTMAKSRPKTLGDIVNVRSAKTHLSALLELAAAGHEITITSDGAPKAKLIGMKKAERRKTFQGMGDFLSRQPVHGGPPAEEMIREDRDSRGW
jgi:prevent-host-death family protein